MHAQPILIRQGRDIPLKGVAAKRIEETPLPQNVAIQPTDFIGWQPRLLVEVSDCVKVGTPLIQHKEFPEINVVSPASGTVSAVERGPRRRLEKIVISLDGKQEKEPGRTFTREALTSLSAKEIREVLLHSGAWVFLRRRPFSTVAWPTDTPKAIFVQAVNTEPLAADEEFVVSQTRQTFQAGLDILGKLTKGQVYLCCHAKASSPVLLQARGVSLKRFDGPHPAGNVGTHIHSLEPLVRGEVAWYLRAQEVVNIAQTFLTGGFSPERIVALTGEGVTTRVYKKTLVGAPVAHLVSGRREENLRYLSGSVLTGADVGFDGHVRFYDTQVTVLPLGGARKLLGWLDPGLRAFSFSQTFLSSLRKQKEVSLDTDAHGSRRAVILNHVYDRYVALEVMTFFLLRAILSGDLDEAERLGLWECDEEDFALASFACPSKVDVGAIIRQGLDMMAREESVERKT